MTCRSDDAEVYYRDRDPLERELDDDYETDEKETFDSHFHDEMPVTDQTQSW